MIQRLWLRSEISKEVEFCVNIAREISILKDRVAKILKSGATLILTSLGIDDLAQKYLIEAGVIGVRRVDKADLRRIARSSGATVITTMAN